MQPSSWVGGLERLVDDAGGGFAHGEVQIRRGLDEGRVGGGQGHAVLGPDQLDGRVNRVLCLGATRGRSDLCGR